MNKIKLCGFKNIEDINFALSSGADYVGLNNISISKRFVTANEILNLVTALNLDQRIKIVVLINHFDEDFLWALRKLGVKLIQSYLSDENDKKLFELGFEVIKCFPVADNNDLAELLKTKFDDYAYLLLDTKSEGLGGSGASFDWTLFAQAKAQLTTDIKLILAGGLNETNIKQAIETSGADFVDLASGVEVQSGENQGNKSYALIKKVVDITKAGL